jgi:hypothetical protein
MGPDFQSGQARKSRHSWNLIIVCMLVKGDWQLGVEESSLCCGDAGMEFKEKSHVKRDTVDTPHYGKKTCFHFNISVESKMILLIQFFSIKKNRSTPSTHPNKISCSPPTPLYCLNACTTCARNLYCAIYSVRLSAFTHATAAAD